MVLVIIGQIVERQALKLERYGAACSIVVKVLDPQDRWFDLWCGHDKICTAIGPLSKALNPIFLQGEISPA